MTALERLTPANHYQISGGADGVIDTAGFSGKPSVQITVDGQQIADAELQQTEIGLEVTGIVDAQPDLYTVHARLLLPRVNVHSDPVACAGLLILVRVATSIAGPRLIEGAVESYETRPVAGHATAVEF